MDTIKQLVDSLMTWLLLPTTLFGAGGAAICAMRKGRCRRQVILEGIGGILIANMAGPLITLHAPEHWHYTLYFIVGWGGLEGVGRLYEAAVSGLERRIQDKIGAEGPLAVIRDKAEHSASAWDGVERRKGNKHGDGES